MAARSCTPPRGGASPDSNSFICYHRLSDFTPERSRTPPTPRRSDNYNPPSGNIALGAGDALLATPRAPLPPPVFCTPQTSREELQLRSSLDAELSHCRADRFAAQPPLTFLVDGLYVGGLPDDEAVAALRREGVGVIINCCAQEYDTTEALQREFAVHSLFAEDRADYFILFHCYDRFAEIVNEARRCGRRVFVHCIAGVNRSVTLCMAYLMQYYGMDPLRCVQLFRARCRPDILRNVAFRHQLVDFYLNTPRA